VAGTLPAVCAEALHQLAKGLSDSVASKESLMILCKFGKAETEEEEFDEGCFRSWVEDVVHVGVVVDAKELEVFDPSLPGAVEFLERGFSLAVPDAIVDSTIEEIQAVICFGSRKIWKV
jgi:hypothetical protein